MTRRYPPDIYWRLTPRPCPLLSSFHHVCLAAFFGGEGVCVYCVRVFGVVGAWRGVYARRRYRDESLPLSSLFHSSYPSPRSCVVRLVAIVVEVCTSLTDAAAHFAGTIRWFERRLCASTFGLIDATYEGLGY